MTGSANFARGSSNTGLESGLARCEQRIGRRSNAVTSNWPSLHSACGRLALASFLVLVPAVLRAQAMSPEEVRADVATLRQALEEGHAGLDRNGGRQLLMSRLDNISAEPPSERSALLWAMGEALAAIRDGHTVMKWPLDLIQDRMSRPVWLPFAVVAQGDRLWIGSTAERAPSRGRVSGQDKDQDPVRVGSELLAIEGRPWTRIRPRLAAVISADAGIESAVDWTLSQPGKLSFLLGELYGHREQWRLLLRDPDGRVEERIIRGVQASELPLQPSTVDQPWELKIEAGTAILRIRHFVPYFYRRAELDFPALLQSTFTRLEQEQAHSLVLDVRGNRGGSEDYVRDLLRYLLPQPFGYYRVAEMKRKQLPFLASLEPELELPTVELPGPRGGWRVPETVACQGVYEPVARPFSGPVLVLTDGGTFSAAAELAALLRSHGRARIAGNSPGGAYDGNTSGAVVEIVLPNSAARVRIPLMELRLEVLPLADGTQRMRPDYGVDITGEQLSSGEDSAMNLALAWARAAAAATTDPKDGLERRDS